MNSLPPFLIPSCRCIPISIWSMPCFRKVVIVMGAVVLWMKELKTGKY